MWCCLPVATQGSFECMCVCVCVCVRERERERERERDANLHGGERNTKVCGSKSLVPAWGWCWGNWTPRLMQPLSGYSPMPASTEGSSCRTDTAYTLGMPPYPLGLHLLRPVHQSTSFPMLCGSVQSPSSLLVHTQGSELRASVRMNHIKFLIFN